MTASRTLTSQRRPLIQALLCATCLTLQACVMVPRTIERYDPDCRSMKREMTLEMVHVGVFRGCSQDACAAMLAAAGVVTAASLVVSGSVAVVGNVVYWFENQKQCGSVSTPTEPAPN